MPANNSAFGMTYSWGAGAGTWNANFDNRTYPGHVAGSGGASVAGSHLGLDAYAFGAEARALADEVEAAAAAS